MKTFLHNNIFYDFTVVDPLFIVNMHISHYKNLTDVPNKTKQNNFFVKFLQS